MKRTRTTDIKGKRYGRLLAEEFVGRNHRNNALWKCTCDCGEQKVLVLSELNRGAVKSCGCLARELASERTAKVAQRHGHCSRDSRSSEYDAWRSMKKRCLNPSYVQWKDYGGRGITICQEWIDSFDAFLSDVGPKPEPHLSLDRIDNNGNYEASNVRWADRTTQSRNRRNYRGEGVAV